MKFFVAGKEGAIAILDNGTVTVCESVNEQRLLLEREAPDARAWKSENVECFFCKASWCEIRKHGMHRVTCPECGRQLDL